MPEQRRNHQRLPLASTTFIELLAPGPGQSESGKMVTCSTMDVSRGGLQVKLSESLILNTILQIGVDLPNAADTLYLAGEVCWCQPSNDEQHPRMAGLQILHANGSDIDTWIALVEAMAS